MRSSSVDLLPVLGVILLSLLCGYLLGRLVTTRVTLPAAPISMHEVRTSPVPTVQIDGIRNGNLEGIILGGARLAIGGRVVPTGADGAFSVPAGSFLVNTVTISIPDGMQFVASRRGKKYYPVGSAGAANLSLENRIYFRTEEEARKAGYR